MIGPAMLVNDYECDGHHNDGNSYHCSDSQMFIQEQYSENHSCKWL